MTIHENHSIRKMILNKVKFICSYLNLKILHKKKIWIINICVIIKQIQRQSFGLKKSLKLNIFFYFRILSIFQIKIKKFCEMGCLLNHLQIYPIYHDYTLTVCTRTHDYIDYISFASNQNDFFPMKKKKKLY